MVGRNICVKRMKTLVAQVEKKYILIFGVIVWSWIRVPTHLDLLPYTFDSPSSHIIEYKSFSLCNPFTPYFYFSSTDKKMSNKNVEKVNN